jgi:DNA replication protein DnaC
MLLRWRQSARQEKRPIAQFPFAHHQSRTAQKPRLLPLLTLDCLSAHREVLLRGTPGTGNTFLATCLADAACNAKIKGLFPPAIAMIKQLIAAEADHALVQQLPHSSAPDRLGGDALGSLSLGQQGSHLFFQLIRQRHQQHSTVLTTHVPCAEWGKVFDSTTVATAIADRLVPDSEVLILGGTSSRRPLP